ncbi:copper fist DNA binding domain-containing protein [Pterulicium gracile]|uniref:Copper fist DNA binding domain-containing protein n=1 Tax=Pterulicium gracile TaxID=1884261 RepID=A0A5C3QW46_9AGAR|nr:copper fist DNA binding domain-containing protein [Pterula gracilis]
MVIVVNAQKFACESCIKGHRSSSCHHTDRPLYEIKKKGRPVSQCEKCRALRKSKKVHSKCTCDGTPSDSPAPPPPVPGSKARRFIPSTPALPNGIKDVLTSFRTAPALPADTRQMVQTLLNPCNCKSVWKCKCQSQPGDSPVQLTPETGLHALAEAAASCCSPKAPGSPLCAGPKRPSSRSSNKGDRKRQKSAENVEEPPYPGLELPPIIMGPISMPSFPIMPPLSSIAGLAGTGCTCGFECACPGCVEHRGPEHASSSHADCAGGNCAHCVDNESGIAFSLPGVPSGYTSSMDLFFARAAALPAPPSKLKPGALDPTDIKARYGLVTVPKLECCGGNCRCPGGQCGCGQICNGCCDEHLAEQSQPVAPILVVTPPPVRSCCAGKKRM